MAPHVNVFGHAEFFEHHRFLVHRQNARGLRCLGIGERLRDAPQSDHPLVHRHHSRQHFDQRGLSGAVFTHKGQHFSGLQLQIHPAQGMGCPIALVDALQTQQYIRHCAKSNFS